MVAVPSKADLSTAAPEAARKLFRQGHFFKEPVAGVCQGHVQANLLGLDKALAEDFARFCQANSGPLPVLYKSEAGQFTAPGITQTDSDVRTDLPAYSVLENGKVTRVVPDILDLGDRLRDFVFFYIGCSFSFDRHLLSAGVPLRNIEHNCCVSIFKTGVMCRPVGPFSCPIVTSMKPIPRDLVETAFKSTHNLTLCHGAPVHIGNPDLLGIADINKPEYTDPVVSHEGDIPVFWACGVTLIAAMQSLKPEIAITNYEGDALYIADMKTQEQDGTSSCIKVIPLTEEPFWASVASVAVVDKIKQLEAAIAQDVGKRQNSHLVVPGDLLKSALALSHASSVAVAAGFPCFPDSKKPYEIAAIAVAAMLRALGKKVELLADKMLHGPLTAVLEALLQQKVLDGPIPVVQYPPEGQADTLETARAFLAEKEGTAPRYDHLLAIETIGMAEDGANYTARSNNAGGIDWLFVAAADMPTVYTSGIGDGGDELGMGQIKGTPTGPTTASSAASDFLVTTGVSNWGGYGLAVALYLLSICPIHERYQRRAVDFPPSEEDRRRFRGALPDIDREKMLGTLVSREFSNMTETDVLDAGGLFFKDVHARKIEELLGIAVDQASDQT